MSDRSSRSSEEAVAANLALWEEWARVNAKSAFYDTQSFKRGGVRLRAEEIEEIGDVRGRSLLHLQCHFGLDTLSWVRLGARVTGVDFSEQAIALARELAADCALEATFVRSSIDDLPDHLQGRFDVVYTSRGVLGWLPDLDRWARVVAHFLEPGGLFYISEIHPVANAFHDDELRDRDLRLRWPYFPRGGPVEYPVNGSYADRDAEISQRSAYDFLFTVGDVVTALVRAGLRIETLREYPFCEWELSYAEKRDDGRWYLPADAGGELPLFFSIAARKPRAERG